MRRIVALLSALLSFAGTMPSARAAASPRLVVIAEGADDVAFEQRLAAELRAMGFDVVERTAPQAEMPELAAEAHAAGVVRINGGRELVEIWLPRSAATETEVEDQVTTRDTPDNVVSYRVTELLRDELLRREHRAATSDQAVPQPAVMKPRVVVANQPEPVAAEAPFTLGIGAAIVASPGGISAGLLPVLDARVELVGAADAFALLAPPVWNARVAAPGGRANIHVGLAALGAELALPLRARSPWTIRVGAGILVSDVVMSGLPEPPYRGQSSSVWTAGPFMRAELELRLTRELRIALDPTLAVMPSRTDVRFAGREVAHFGQPVALGQLAMRWGF